MSDFTILYAVAIGVPILIAISSGRTVLAIVISLVVWNIVFILMNIRGHNFLDIFSTSLAMSIFSSILITAATLVGIFLRWVFLYIDAKLPENNLGIELEDRNKSE
ncbi:MAG: hypothetical protein ACAH12_01155 [Methylophilaceae bacterium]